MAYADLVAGHDFDSLGNCKRLQGDGSRCPISWRSIADCTEKNVDEVGIAHFGKLSYDESVQIRHKRADEIAAYDRAMNPFGRG